jgi:hypothetical protein
LLSAVRCLLPKPASARRDLFAGSVHSIIDRSFAHRVEANAFPFARRCFVYRHFLGVLRDLARRRRDRERRAHRGASAIV